MSPKEKAIDLVEDMQNAPEVGYNEHAKQCALIAVDEILKSNPTSEYSDPFIGNKTYSNVDYWQKVKQEIEKL